MDETVQPLLEADASALGLGMSMNEIRSAFSAAVREAEATDPDGDGDNDTYIYVYDLYPAPLTGIYETNMCGDDGPYRARPFSIDAGTRKVTLGEATIVTRKTVWIKANPATQESDRPRDTLYEAGSRHSAADAQHIADADAHLGQAMHHVEHAKEHVTNLGTSTPPATGGMYGGGFLPLIQSAREVGMQESHAGADVSIVEVGSGGVGAFMEATVDGTPKGVIAMTIIRPGFNVSRSRYYTKESIASAQTKGTFAGKQMYLNHPTLKEERELPERDMTKIGGYITETSLGKDGELLGKAVILNPTLKGMLAEAQQHGILDKVLGVSINANGSVREGTVEGHKTHIVEDFTHGKSVDFVTQPGAGGRIGLLESHDGPEKPVAEGAGSVNEEQIKAMLAKLESLEESNRALSTQVTESRQETAKATAVARVQGTVATRLAEFAEADLPQIAKKRITLMFESAESAERLEEAIEAEVKYVKEIKATAPAVRGGVTGLGSRVSESGTDVIAPTKPSENKGLVEAFGREIAAVGGQDAAKELIRKMSA